MDYQEILPQIIERSKKMGAQGADLIFVQSESHSLKVLNQEIDKTDFSNTHSIGLRVVVDDKIGLSYSESLDLVDTDKMVAMAIDNAKHSTPRIDEKISDISGTLFHEGPLLEDIPVEKKYELAKKLESCIKDADHRVKACPYNGLTTRKTHFIYANSSGRFCSHRDSAISYGSSALIEENGQSALHYYYTQTKKWDDINFDLIRHQALGYASDLLKGHSIKTGAYDVIFDTDALSSLMGFMLPLFSVQKLLDKTNPWGNKLGQKVASELITIVDTPRYEGAFSQSYFDGEGFEQEPLNLITAGVLQELWQNSYTANKTKMKNNHRASRGTKEKLSISGTTLSIRASGNAQIDRDLHSGEYLLIKTIVGLGTGSNLSSGDMSFGATGYLMNEGKVLSVVKEITMAGNIFHLLNSVEAVGSSIKSDAARSFFAPEIRFTGLTVAGK